jgi:formylmethanofuran dehydrogenase subunit D
VYIATFAPIAWCGQAYCEQLAIASGDRVKFGNQRGEIVVHAKVFD